VGTCLHGTACRCSVRQGRMAACPAHSEGTHVCKAASVPYAAGWWLGPLVLVRRSETSVGHVPSQQWGFSLCHTPSHPLGNPPCRCSPQQLRPRAHAPAACCWAVAADSQHTKTSNRAVVIFCIAMTVRSPAGRPQSPAQKSWLGLFCEGARSRVESDSVYRNSTSC
jgi:hypothetical protein